jgi:RNA polymerase sigma factor (sigma-70 family)
MTEILDDDALMARIQDGDEQAFECLVRRWDARIAMVIRRMSIVGSDVDDLRQEVFIRVLRGANRYALNTRFSAWINRLTLNAIRDWQRKRVPKPMDMDEVTTDAGHVIVQVADRELADTVETALQQIDEGLSFLNNDSRSLQKSIEPLNIAMVLDSTSSDVGVAVENSSPVGISFDGSAPPVRRSRVATAIRVCSTACSVIVALLVVVAATVVFTRGRLELSDVGIWIAWNESSESSEPTSAERRETQANLQRMSDLKATLERQSKETQLVRRQLAAVARVLQSEDELRRNQMSRLEGRLSSIVERGNTRWKTLSRLLTASTETTADEILVLNSK